MTPKKKIIIIRDIFKMTNKGIGEILGHSSGVTRLYFGNSEKNEYSEAHVAKLINYLKKSAREL